METDVSNAGRDGIDPSKELTLFRLQNRNQLVDETKVLLASPLGVESARRFEMAGRDFVAKPAWADGATVLVPIGHEEILLRQWILMPYHVVGFASDFELIHEALKKIPRRKGRPKVCAERRPTMSHRRADGDRYASVESSEGSAAGPASATAGGAANAGVSSRCDGAAAEPVEDSQGSALSSSGSGRPPSTSSSTCSAFVSELCTSNAGASHSNAHASNNTESSSLDVPPKQARHGSSQYIQEPGDSHAVLHAHAHQEGSPDPCASVPRAPDASELPCPRFGEQRVDPY